MSTISAEEDATVEPAGGQVPEVHTVTLHGQSPFGFCVWQWVEAELRWLLMKDFSAPGSKPGGGPIEPGRYEGQIVRWPCSDPDE